MTTILAVGGAALLFVAFGLLRRGWEPETERGCCGACPGCDRGRCDLKEESTDAIA